MRIFVYIGLLYMCMNSHAWKKTVKSPVKKVKKAAQLKIHMVSYTNPKGHGSNGQCCDGKWGMCQKNGCDHFFKICLDSASGSSSKKKSCSYHSVTTDQIENQNTNKFGKTIGKKTPNPIIIPLAEPIPRQVMLKVEVWDKDIGRNDHVDTLSKSLDPTRSGSYTLGKRTTLQIRTEFECESWFVDARCPCKVRGNIARCNREKAVCKPGWRGDTCTTKGISSPPKHSGRPGQSSVPGHNRRPGQSSYKGHSGRPGQSSYPSHNSRPGQSSYKGHSGRPGQSSYPGHNSRPGQSSYKGHSGRPGQSSFPGHNSRPGQSSYKGNSRQPVQPTKGCPSDWKEFNRHCYAFSVEEKSWEEARQRCQGAGGDLLEIDTWPEDRFISDTLRKHVKTRGNRLVWIGLNDKTREGTWVWNNGTPMRVRRWMLGEPTSRRGDEDCAAVQQWDDFNRMGRWVALSCRSKRLNFICEKH